MARLRRGLRKPTVALSQIISQPRTLIWEVRGQLTTVNRAYHRLAYKNKQYPKIMDESWDSLILLDACRYDYFSEMDWFQGELEMRESGGSNSSEFLEYNFSGGEFHDTVYVSANPYGAGIEPSTFHDVNLLLDLEWNEQIETVHPEKVLEAALQAHQEYPNKRIIIHFMQPHAPFIDKKWRYLNDKIKSWGGMWALPNDVSIRELRKAYKDNLNIVLKFVERLVEEIGGKIVISSDHGELLGERQFPIPIQGYEHMPGLHLPKLRQVPWLIIDEDADRRKITVEPPIKDSLVREEVAEDRLDALGYVDSLGSDKSKE